MIFIDSNIPMYLIGSAHPHKIDARRLLEQAISERERLVTNAEALQEILHRYHAIKRPEAIQPAFEAMLGIVDEVFPVEKTDVLKAKDLLLGLKRLSSRDALHVASMHNHAVKKIMTFDQGFDGIPGITRIC